MEAVSVNKRQYNFKKGMEPYNKKAPGISARNHLFRLYRCTAERRGLPFEISIDYFSFLTQQNCFYCGAEPNQICRKTDGYSQYKYNGIDRKDNTKGYVFGNVVPCCKICNRAKNKMGYEDFMEWKSKITQFTLAQIESVS